MNRKHYVVIDFETGGLDPYYHEAIQVAGKAYNGRTLEPFPVDQGGEFASLMRPMHPERLTDDALRINGKTRDELEKAPLQGLVWNSFCDWLKKYDKPIVVGKNARDFDLVFVEVLNKLHCPKKDKTVLFARMPKINVEDYLFAWFESTDELPDYKMDTIRKAFGLSTEGAHDALVDVQQTGTLFVKFMRLHRHLRKMKNKDGKPFIRFLKD